MTYQAEFIELLSSCMSDLAWVTFQFCDKVIHNIYAPYFEKINIKIDFFSNVNKHLLETMSNIILIYQI